MTPHPASAAAPHDHRAAPDAGRQCAQATQRVSPPVDTRRGQPTDAAAPSHSPADFSQRFGGRVPDATIRAATWLARVAAPAGVRLHASACHADGEIVLDWVGRGGPGHAHRISASITSDLHLLWVLDGPDGLAAGFDFDLRAHPHAADRLLATLTLHFPLQSSRALIPDGEKP